MGSVVFDATGLDRLISVLIGRGYRVVGPKLSDNAMWSSDGTRPEDPPRYAFIGVRACDLSAIAILNGVLGVGTHPDQRLVSQLRRIFVVAVNCTEPGGLCFCASMGTGPQADPGYDLALTERTDADGCHYVVDVATDDGAEVLATIPHSDADQPEVDSARSDVNRAAHRMGRQMPEGDLRELLVVSRESPRWEDVAGRCLTCGD